MGFLLSVCSSRAQGPFRSGCVDQQSWQQTERASEGRERGQRRQEVTARRAERGARSWGLYSIMSRRDTDIVTEQRVTQSRHHTDRSAGVYKIEEDETANTAFCRPVLTTAAAGRRRGVRAGPQVARNSSVAAENRSITRFRLVSAAKSVSLRNPILAPSPSQRQSSPSFLVLVCTTHRKGEEGGGVPRLVVRRSLSAPEGL